MFIDIRKMLASTLAAVALAGAAYAADDTTHVQSHLAVDFSDLNLNRQADVQKLYARLKRASRDVCADVWGREVSNAMRRRQCETEAIAKAVEDVGRSGVRVAALQPAK